jgi:hypothetical protein|tara:strand:- start:592 stop:840 length:249 start_codon:yes stop_codon:yes gene_type:complete
MLDKYKDKDNLSVSYNVNTKTTTIEQDDVVLESINYSSLKSAKNIAKDLGLQTVSQLKVAKAIFNLDGSPRGYHAFREEKNG